MILMLRVAHYVACMSLRERGQLLLSYPVIVQKPLRRKSMHTKKAASTLLLATAYYRRAVAPMLPRQFPPQRVPVNLVGPP